MFYTTTEQNLIMQILEQTGWMRTEHVLRLMQGKDPKAELWQAEKSLRQLRYMGKLVFQDGGAVSLPYLPAADPVMLDAVTVMLDIADGAPNAVSSTKKPYLLTFLALMGPKKDRLTGFGILPVPDGEERQALLLAHSSDLPHVPVFLLSHEQQQKEISLPSRHYFALCREGRFQYREGGGAG